jgi:hypothetical protein
MENCPWYLLQGTRGGRAKNSVLREELVVRELCMDDYPSLGAMKSHTKAVLSCSTSLPDASQCPQAVNSLFQWAGKTARLVVVFMELNISKSKGPMLLLSLDLAAGNCGRNQNASSGSSQAMQK